MVLKPYCSYRWIVCRNLQNRLTCFLFSGTGQSWVILIFSRSALTCPSSKIYPRKVMDKTWKSHFSAFTKRRFSINLWRTCRTWSLCLWRSLETTRMMSRYTKTYLWRKSRTYVIYKILEDCRRERMASPDSQNDQRVFCKPSSTHLIHECRQDDRRSWCLTSRKRMLGRLVRELKRATAGNIY